jgi:hypothetical protein
MSLPFSQNQFRRALRALPPDAIVGLSRDANHCPLAETLHAFLPHALVWSDSWQTISGPYYRPLPFWAQHFIQNIDDASLVGEPVTAAQALATLDSIASPGEVYWHIISGT